MNLEQFDFICESFVVTDLLGTVIKTSLFFDKMFGYNHKELLEKNISVLNSKIFDTVSIFQRCSEIFHTVTVKKDRSMFLTELSISKINDNMLFIIFREKNIVHKVNDGIILTVNGKIVFTDKITEVLGYDNTDLDNSSICDIIPNFIFENVNTTKKFNCILKDETTKIIECHVFIFDNNINFITLQNSDQLEENTTHSKNKYERKHANNQLITAIENANIEIESKSKFLANMSHEIRTPMNGIFGMLSLLKNTNLDLIQKDYVNTCLRSAEALMSVLNDILLFSKAENEKIVLDKISFDLSVVIEDVVCIASSSIDQNKDIDVVYFIDDDVPTKLIGDPFRLRQILINLLSNAIKFTQMGEVAVEVSLIEELPLTLKFDVSDTGIGISKDQIPNLFKPFSQIDPSPNRSYGGTGLGLAICKELVKLFEGNIEVNSRLGRGSTFTFIVKLEKDFNSTCENEDIEFKKIIDSLKNKKIIAIDDNAVNCMLLESIFKNIGCNIKTIRSGLQGIDEICIAYLHKKPYDLIILDYHMPNLDGVQVAKILCDKNLDNIKILMVSSSSDQASMINKENIKYFISKPIKKNNLINIVHKIIFDDSKQRTKEIHKGTSKLQSFDQFKKVLIVEDNQINRQIIKNILLSINFEIQEANNGLEAVLMLDKNTDDFAIVIMDIHMPVMDGLTATKFLRDKNINIPIIALTADISLDLEKTCSDIGFNGYLNKPVFPNMLINKIKEVLIGRQISENKLNILIVDDNEINLKILNEIVSRNGYVCYTAKNGLECMKLLIDSDIDFQIVLMDVNMPIMNGQETLFEIRKIGIDIPVIFISGEDSPIFNVKPNDYIVKPVSQNLLIDILNKFKDYKFQNKKLFNSSLINELSRDSVNLKVTILKEYDQQICQAVQQIVTFIENGSNKEISGVSHNLKGSSYQLGLQIIGDLFSKLEKQSEKDEQYLYIELINKFYKLFKEKYC